VQIRVVGNNATITPSPDPVITVDPPYVPPVVTPPIIRDLDTKPLSSVPTSLAANLRPGSRNVLQCALFVPELNQWFSTQATNGTNGSRTPFENTVISRMDSYGTLIDSMTLNNGGHGTSFGVEVVGNAPYIYGTYQANAGYTSPTNDLVSFPYKQGTFDRKQIAGLTVMPKLDSGYDNVAFDWYNDLMVVRNSGGTKDNYIRRKISEWKASIDKTYGKISLQQAPPVLQGFCTINDALFRYIGATNGEQLTPPDPTMIQQYDWLTGRRLDQVDYTALGKTANGIYPGGTHEPESCTMYRELDGTATLTFSVTLDVYPNHQWKVYKLAKIGGRVYSTENGN
jgi:hypothetical protein